MKALSEAQAYMLQHLSVYSHQVPRIKELCAEFRNILLFNYGSVAGNMPAWKWHPFLPSRPFTPSNTPA